MFWKKKEKAVKIDHVEVEIVAIYSEENHKFFTVLEDVYNRRHILYGKLGNIGDRFMAYTGKEKNWTSAITIELPHDNPVNTLSFPPVKLPNAFEKKVKEMVKKK